MSMNLKKALVSAEKRLTPVELIEFMKQMKGMVNGESTASLPGLIFLTSPTPGVNIFGAHDDTFELLEVNLTSEQVDRIFDAWQEHLASFSLDLKEILEVPVPDGIDEVLVRCVCGNEPSNRIVRTGFFEN